MECYVTLKYKVQMYTQVMTHHFCCPSHQRICKARGMGKQIQWESQEKCLVFFNPCVCTPNAEDTRANTVVQWGLTKQWGHAPTYVCTCWCNEHLGEATAYQTGSIHSADNGEMSLSLFHSIILIIEASHTDGNVTFNDLDHIPLSHIY